MARILTFVESDGHTYSNLFFLLLMYEYFSSQVSQKACRAGCACCFSAGIGLLCCSAVDVALRHTEVREGFNQYVSLSLPFNCCHPLCRWMSRDTQQSCGYEQAEACRYDSRTVVYGIPGIRKPSLLLFKNRIKSFRERANENSRPMYDRPSPPRR